MRIFTNHKAFTLIELLLAVAILAFALTSMLLLFFNCIILNKTNRSITYAYNALQAKMEEIKNTSFASLYATCPDPRPSGCFCNGDTFDLDGFASGDGGLRIEISDETDRRKLVRIKTCFKTGHNRWIDSCNINNTNTWNSKIVTFISK
jgi:prepilin-type N-terminal cleavage/methylation domain-containing protein